MIPRKLDDARWLGQKNNTALSEKNADGSCARRGRPRHADRPFVEAMLWIARTGCPWRDLPSEFPNWRSVDTRWRRWVRQRLWAKVLAQLVVGHD